MMLREKEGKDTRRSSKTAGKLHAAQARVSGYIFRVETDDRTLIDCTSAICHSSASIYPSDLSNRSARYEGTQ